MDLKPDPVDILGIAKIVRSPSDQSTGPWFYVDARQSPPFINVSWSRKLLVNCFHRSYLLNIQGKITVCYLFLFSFLFCFLSCLIG